MLYLIRKLSGKRFKPLTGEDIKESHSIEVNGVKFQGLTLRQFSILQELKEHKELFEGIDN